MSPVRNNQDEALTVLQAQFEALRVAYERFFAGVDRVEPAPQRAQFAMMLKQVLAGPAKSTAQGFRLQNIKARALTYMAMWDRALAALEASGGPKLNAAKNSKAGPPAPPGPAHAPSAGVGPGVDPTAQLTALHQEFMAAAQQTGHPSKMDFQAFCALVARQTESIKAQTQWQQVGMRVVVDNGRPALKAFRRP